MEILIVILAAILVAAFYLMWRNDKVCNFQIEIGHKCYDVLINFLGSLKDDKEFSERYGEYEQLKTKKDEILSKHSYCSMLFSLKRLKFEHWYTKEEIEFMNLKFVSKIE
ncbi:MAG: hypothetical protein J6W64_04780 [Bacilli bacterium]|nr:hypothetical protein [Bacilli bacterium]